MLAERSLPKGQIKTGRKNSNVHHSVHIETAPSQGTSLQPLLHFHRLQFTFPLGKKGIQILREKRKIKARGIWMRWQKTADGQRANTRLSSLLGLWYRSQASDASRAPLQTCAPASTRGSLPTPPCWSRDVSQRQWLLTTRTLELQPSCTDTRSSSNAYRVPGVTPGFGCFSSNQTIPKLPQLQDPGLKNANIRGKQSESNEKEQRLRKYCPC